MAQRRSFGLPFALFILASLGAAVAQAQASSATTQSLSAVAQVSRLAGDWHSTESVAIANSTPPASKSETDLGSAPAGQRLERMVLLLAPSAAQQQALTVELANLTDSTSSSYHQWLTPSAFASAYSNSATDVAAISAWLQSQGLTVTPLPAGRGWIEFSGTVAQVEQAFQTQIHSVTTVSGTRPVLAASISVPAALKPLISGLVSLDGSFSTAALTTPLSVSTAVADLAAQTSMEAAEALTPQLAAQLLQLDALHKAGVNGTGQTIAIASRSNVASADVAAFRAAFALPALPLKVVLNGSDPGLADDQAQATLAASWAGAAAPRAQIVLVPAASTSATDGVDLSLAAIVDQALASTVAVGYSACEAGMSTAHQAFYSTLYQQAAAEGIAMVAAVGDSGASACQLAGSDTPVSSGYGVNALASTPWNTAVGVAGYGTAGPVAGTVALAAWSPVSTTDPAYAGGGGSSTLYAVPSWQSSSASNVSPVSSSSQASTASSASSSSYRLLPDLSLPTALDSGANHGLAFCLSTSTSSTSTGCTLVRSGGSSAAAAIFAGISALVAEKNGTQGNLAPSLYSLSKTSGVFNDVQQGSAQLSCVAGTSGCGSSEKIGFTAVSGYDTATGLGTVNAQSLVNHWATPMATGTTAASVTWITATQTITLSDALTLKVTVASDDTSVTTTPTGTVTFTDETESTTLGTITLSSGVATLNLTAGTLATGSHLIDATYNGSTTYATVTSGTITITVSALISTTTTLTLSESTVSPGGSLILKATVVPAAQSTSEAYPTGTVEFLSGTTLIGSATLAEVGVSDTSVASIVVSESTALAAGTDSITAVYLGDTYYATSTSAAVSVIIQDFTITAASTNSATNLDIVKGSSGSASFVITGYGGYASEIQVICAVPSQDYMTCTPTPQQVTPTATVTFVVATFTTGSVTTSANRHPEPQWLRTAGGTALAALLFFLLPFGKRARTFIRRSTGRMLILLLLLTGLAGTGIGCTNNTAIVSTGTPLGVATLKITASAYVDNAVVSKSTYLTVNVLAN